MEAKGPPRQAALASVSTRSQQNRVVWEIERDYPKREAGESDLLQENDSAVSGHCCLGDCNSASRIAPGDRSILQN